MDVQHTLFVGIDAHKDTLSICALRPSGKPLEWKIETSEAAIKRLAQKLRKHSDTVVTAYEAGPTGFQLQRTLERLGITCKVVAPALIPKKVGERIKTDRRDAKKLAELLRAGMLTEVRAPTPEEEAVRDLCRTRWAVKQDLIRCRHRLKHFLLRRDRLFSGPNHWTKSHHEWLRKVTFAHEADNLSYNELYRGVTQLEDRVKHLDEVITQCSEQPPYKEPCAHLRCFRGMDTLIAMTILTELHGFGRFLSPRALMAYLGLVPSEYASGQKKRRGGLTKTGNAHVRRMLVEASHHCSKNPKVSTVVSKRRRNQPIHIVHIAEKAQYRLHKKYWRLFSAGKPRNLVIGAVAREFVGFIWDILQNSTPKDASTLQVI